MSIYRFRAHNRGEVYGLYRNIAQKVKNVTMTIKPPFPDIEVELETDMSLIIGSKEFVSTNYQRFKHLFFSKHEKKPRPIKGLEGMYSLKRLSEIV
jgi:hypothetical protein